MGSERSGPRRQDDFAAQRIHIADEHFSDVITIPATLKELSQVDFTCNSEQLMFVEVLLAQLH